MPYITIHTEVRLESKNILLLGPIILRLRCWELLLVYISIEISLRVKYIYIYLYITQDVLKLLTNDKVILYNIIRSDNINLLTVLQCIKYFIIEQISWYFLIDNNKKNCFILINIILLVF